jgi:hypothetical protein
MVCATLLSRTEHTISCDYYKEVVNHKFFNLLHVCGGGAIGIIMVSGKGITNAFIVNL